MTTIGFDRSVGLTPPVELRRRQIAIGKNTPEYQRYRELVPKARRKFADPQTPPEYEDRSHRWWMEVLRRWRVALHRYDPPRPVIDTDALLVALKIAASKTDELTWQLERHVRRQIADAELNTVE